MATQTVGDFPLATDTVSHQGEDASAGSVGASPGSAADGTLAGASGSSSGGIQLSGGALIAIIVVVVVVGLVGIASTVLFFFAKKREWTMRETLRRSARKVVTALTPRRSEFPSSVKGSVGRGGRGGRMNKLDEVPPTPSIKPSDLEKGLEVRIGKPPARREKRQNFSRK
ncbi:hypothetical protein B0T18DRAFT_328454 [Schizothecium vesticola]|uniref:Uncharacterized protein n=1 Tax=Schizothecium vesticola TaxID=314040 RepID=A0AA40K292_9PEZI|nr:hypothetical protein B0T18DRAFT_328454 [Schizothecium vesticola]